MILIGAFGLFWLGNVYSHICILYHLTSYPLQKRVGTPFSIIFEGWHRPSVGHSHPSL